MDNLELESLRNKIDQIDTSLCQMIKERQSLASKIMNAKKGDFPFDPDREEKLINQEKKLISLASSLFSHLHVSSALDASSQISSLEQQKKHHPVDARVASSSLYSHPLACP